MAAGRQIVAGGLIQWRFHERNLAPTGFLLHWLHVFCFLRFPGCIPHFFLQGISDCHDTVAAGDRSKLQALSSLGLKPQGFGFLLRDASADTTAFSSEVTLEVTFFRSQVLKCGVPDSPAT